EEAGLPPLTGNDEDNDGIDDAIEAQDFANPVDTDGDGTPDFQDTDSDNDGIDDALEGNNDFNNNGVPDYLERDGQLQTALEGFGGGGALTPLLLVIAFGALALRRRRQVAALAVVCLALSWVTTPSARAGDDCTVGGDYAWSQCWYAGLGLGYSYVSPDEQAQNFVHDASENHDGGLGLFVGKRFTSHWFAELRYADLGEAGLVNLNPAVNAAFPNAAIDYRVPSIMGGYRFWPERTFRPFAKAGVSFIRNEASGAPLDFDKQTGVQIAFGGGVDFQLPGSAWFARGDIDWYDRDAWFAGIYVGRSFGRGERRRESVASEAAAPTPAPEPPPARIADGDYDQIPDADDRCPSTPRGEPVDATGCVPDTDGDRVADRLDACPGTATGVSVDATGCPESLDYDWPTVRFAYKSDNLTPDSANKLDAAALWLLDHPSVTVELVGHTDTVGGHAYNQPLSARRAAQVLQYLVDRGVPRARLSSIGYGQRQPIADNQTEQGRALNRRVELRRSDVASQNMTSTVPPMRISAKSSLPVVRFAYKSNALDADSARALEELAATLLASPRAGVRITGYTDNIGGAAYNTRLSERRALVVADFLMARGVRADQVEVIGLGPTDPIATNATEQGRALNRRVVLSWR
ncbi:MAG: OmpA family protein, partial [Gammaproteobacteria bacterium]